MKRIFALLLTLVLALAPLTGCAGKDAPAPAAASASYNAGTAADQPSPDVQVPLPSPNGTADGDATLKNARFVMIYNPNIFDEWDPLSADTTSLFTGSIGSQIVTGISRSGELDPEPTSGREMISPYDLMGEDGADRLPRTGGRGGASDPVYSKNDTHSFYCNTPDMTARVKREFTCVYEGAHCYIWTFDGAIGETDAARIGAEFDETIFPADVAYYGVPRFTDNGGKVNILIYPLTSAGLCGFFYYYDNFASSEVYGAPQELIDRLGPNTDHAIININSKILTSLGDEFVFSTLAHELQHQIVSSDMFYYYETPYMRPWLNEAMSMYAEDLIYPGINTEGHYNEFFYVSNNYREGQSLYNFTHDGDETLGDYGIVCLFGRYLDKYAGTDVFRNVHKYWRESYSADVTESGALYAAVPDAFLSAIDGKYAYPERLSASFERPEDEWMSKMTLDFYLETLNGEIAGLSEYAQTLQLDMLYAELRPVSIQGGGRVLVATENGSFTIPADADDGLIYVGLDENFNVTEIIYPN